MDNALSVHQGNDATLTNEKQDNIIASCLVDSTIWHPLDNALFSLSLDSSLRHVDSFRNMIAVASRC